MKQPITRYHLGKGKKRKQGGEFSLGLLNDFLENCSITQTKHYATKNSLISINLALLRGGSTKADIDYPIEGVKNVIDQAFPVSKNIYAEEPAVEVQIQQALCKAQQPSVTADQKLRSHNQSFNNNPSSSVSISEGISQTQILNKEALVKEVVRRRKEAELDYQSNAFKPRSDTKPLFEVPKRLPKDITNTLVKAHRGQLKSTLTPHDLKTLGYGEWLNDEIINQSLTLLKNRSAGENEYPKLHCYTTFFYSTLGAKGYQGVQRWTRRVNIFEMDRLVIPIHLGNHWCMGGVDFVTKTIIYFDSLLGGPRQFFDVMLDYLEKESMDKLKVPFDRSPWVLDAPRRIPTQTNGVDCGVFSILFARCLASPYFEPKSATNAYPFDQSHINKMRDVIGYEIITNKLIGF